MYAMKKILYFLYFLLSSFIAFAQSDSIAGHEWMQTLLKDARLNPTEKISDITQYDLSDLLKTDATDQPVGYITSNYQQFGIFFTSVNKTDKKDTYAVTGKNRVMSNICDFKGTITFTNARFYEHNSDLGNYPDSV